MPVAHFTVTVVPYITVAVFSVAVSSVAVITGYHYEVGVETTKCDGGAARFSIFNFRLANENGKLQVDVHFPFCNS